MRGSPAARRRVDVGVRVPATRTRKRAIRGSLAPAAPPPSNGDVGWLTVRGAAQNNLRRIDVALPLGRFVCVTGVSGSGKSSLVRDIIYKSLARELNDASTLEPGRHDRIEGVEQLDKIIAIDQSPIGRTPRSNPATYIKVFDEIRTLFTKLPDAKLRGYKPGRFSFNVAAGSKGGGRCEACRGNGANKLEMDFLADVWVTCPVCEGRRFQKQTLQIQYKHKSIADVLEMDIQEALAHFDSVPRVRSMLQTLEDVGLDYIKLGQSSPTLSGGEAQRIKLARELVKKPTGRTLYVLDEPTTGLHFEDIRKLLAVLHGFVDTGNSVLVIEHNLDVIKTADWIIDLGPEGGELGGAVVAEGTPEQIAEQPASFTGAALREALNPGNGRTRAGTRHRQKTNSHKSTGKRGGPSRDRAKSENVISVLGARQHNLKNFNVTIPRDRISVCTGVSGSGKTSFAIDTVFNEGYRRYVESLSAYARQFLGRMEKPDVDHIEGLSPAICIEQKAAGKSPRSTVGTITEIYDYMRILWARIGTPHCDRCDRPIGAQTVDQICERVLTLDPGTPIMLLAPLRLGDGETYAGVFNRLRNSGYLRVRIDKDVQRTEHATTLDARQKHRVEVVVDRTVVKPRGRARITESVEHALALGNGVMTLLIESVETVHDEPPADAAEGKPRTRVRKTRERELMFSQKLACTHCGTSFEELTPHHFSFNSQMGWCETCEGLGVQRGAPAAEIIKRPDRSILRGAIAGWPRISQTTPLGRLLAALCERIDVGINTPLGEWTIEQRNTLMFGTSGDWIDADRAFRKARFHWRGFFPAIDAATRNSWMLRHRLHNVVTDIPCAQCRGGRLRSDAAAVRVSGKSIVSVCEMPLADAAEFFRKLRISRREKKIAGELLLEIRNRLDFLNHVGLEYLHLHRAAPTLSGGEAQRIRLASQIGSGLSGVLYVLDEPTIGLHPRDTRRLIDALRKLRELGNTLLLVEHDRDVIAAADHLVDFGPRAGRFGGEIVAEGAPARFAARTNRRGSVGDSLTRDYLRGERTIAIPENRRPVDPAGWRNVRAENNSSKRNPRGKRSGRPARGSKRGTPSALDNASYRNVENPEREWLVIRGARQNNLANIDAPIPLGRFVCVSGVSGSGKSSLINEILWPALAARIQRANLTPGEHDRIDGVEQLDKIISVDQSPIGSTPSSNPATYTGAFDWIRELFARLPESKLHGYAANRFSFNRPGGRCDACDGYGQKRIEMHFMPDVWIECEVCHGKRYNPETLEIRFKGHNISDVLDMRVGDALDLFDNVPKVRRILRCLADVGLDYVQLGQPAPTLSGGEAQRVKLSAELAKPDTGRTLYLLDEPTTGLHFEDARKLLEVIHRLVDLGNSVIVVEHNLDVLKSADWIIDLGPDAGSARGRIVASGPPETIAATPESHTGVALAPLLRTGKRQTRERYDPVEHAARELETEKAGLGRVGKGMKLPWQIDGKKWHLEQRTTRAGGKARWEPRALEYVLDLVQRAGSFEPTNWANRASVEVAAEDAPTWFLHALTGGEWLLELYFRVPGKTFDWRKLDEQLGLAALDDREDLETYGDWARVDVRQRRDGFDAVVVYVHDKQEIDTPAFRRFVKQAVGAYLKGIRPTSQARGLT